MVYVPSSLVGTAMPVPTIVTRALGIGRPVPSSRATPVIVPVVPWAIAKAGLNTAIAIDNIRRRRIISGSPLSCQDGEAAHLVGTNAKTQEGFGPPGSS